MHCIIIIKYIKSVNEFDKSRIKAYQVGYLNKIFKKSSKIKETNNELCLFETGQLEIRLLFLFDKAQLYSHFFMYLKKSCMFMNRPICKPN